MSKNDFVVSRFVITLTVVFGAFWVYLDPDWFHETVLIIYLEIMILNNIFIN